jgi:hypothetical protein
MQARRIENRVRTALQISIRPHIDDNADGQCFFARGASDSGAAA